jgi:septal ring factor EnvC (AmiA/AmiB activator)
MTLPVFAIAVILVLAVLVLTAVWWLGRLQRNWQQQLQQLEQQLDFKALQLQQTRHELEELRAGVIGVGQRVLQLDANINTVNQQLQALADKQQALELTDPESKIYSRAMKMVQLGADLDEIIRECELPRAEAELLYNLHQEKK